MTTDVSTQRLPLRVRRYGQHERPDGRTVFLDGYIVVYPHESEYELAYTIALYRYQVHGRPMPYAAGTPHGATGRGPA